MPLKKKKSINWKHPLTLFILTTLTAAVGWIFTTVWVEIDRSKLRAEMESPRQGIDLVGNIKPSLNGQQVFCDTARFSLVLAHSRDGKTPIVINSISVNAEPVEPEAAKPDPPCNVDVLASRPYGIAERKTFIVTLGKDAISGRYIESEAKDAAWTVSPQNILDGANQRKVVITLKPDEAPISFDFSVTSERARLYKVWLAVNYDANGQKMTETSSLLISR